MRLEATGVALGLTAALCACSGRPSESADASPEPESVSAPTAAPLCRIELPRLNGAKVANEWQPMSALMWVGPSSRCISLMALNTGRSGHPVQKLGGRGGMSPSAAIAGALCADRLFARAMIASASMPVGLTSAMKEPSPLSSTSDTYSPARGK